MQIVHFYDFFQKTRKFLLGVRPVDMIPVEQLGDGRWYVQLSAIWHWYVPLNIYIMFFNFILYSSIPFLYFNLVSIN